MYGIKVEIGEYFVQKGCVDNIDDHFCQKLRILIAYTRHEDDIDGEQSECDHISGRLKKI